MDILAQTISSRSTCTPIRLDIKALLNEFKLVCRSANTARHEARSFAVLGCQQPLASSTVRHEPRSQRAIGRHLCGIIVDIFVLVDVTAYPVHVLRDEDREPRPGERVEYLSHCTYSVARSRCYGPVVDAGGGPLGARGVPRGTHPVNWSAWRAIGLLKFMIAEMLHLSPRQQEASCEISVDPPSLGGNTAQSIDRTGSSHRSSHVCSDV